MVRLSSEDAALLLDVMEPQALEPGERERLLEGAKPEVRAIADALTHPGRPIEDAEIREAVESIQRWNEETRLSEERDSAA